MDHQEFKKRVMKRILLTRFLQRFFQPVWLGFLLAGVSFVSIAASESLYNVVINMSQLRDISGLLYFLTSAFRYTEIQIQILSLMTISGFLLSIKGAMDYLRRLSRLGDLLLKP